MNTKIKTLVFSIALLYPFASGVLNAQDTMDTIKRLNSNIDTVRMNTFYHLLDSANSKPAKDVYGEGYGGAMKRLAAYAKEKQLTIVLIKLLERENARIYNPASKNLTEGDGVYHGDLIAAVAALRDPQALDALYGAIGTGGLAMRGLVDLAEVAIPKLLSEMHSKEWHHRSSIMHTLKKMVDRKEQLSIGASNLSKIRVGLLESLKDENEYVRRQAVETLIHFNDAEVRTAIQKIANNDPSVRKDAKGQKVYPVRAAAQDWLKRHPKQ